MNDASQPNKKYVSISEMLDNFIAEYRTDTATEVSWTDIVGENLSDRCELLNINHHVAIIEVQHPAVAQSIMLQKRTIIKRMNEAYSGLDIKSIKTVIKKFYKHGTPAENKADLPKPQKELEKHNKNTVLNDKLPEELKAVFKNIETVD